MNVRFMMAALTALVLTACGTGPSQEPTPEAQPAAQAQELGKQCGTNTCGAGEFCCNESCGICAPKGGFCTQQVCEPSTLCGTNTCGTGEFCCNASCGICAPVGGGCTQQVCDPVVVEELPVAPVNKVQPPDQDAGKKCGINSCGAGEYCCNESCGICVPMGNSCTQEVCPPPL